MALTPDQQRRMRMRRMNLLMAYAAAFNGSRSTFTPADLFESGEIGAWYDPSDLTTMFQNSAGTTPVTAVGQAVGLVLDKSQGLALGSELVSNGTFNSATTGWSGAGTVPPTLASVSGELRLTSNVIGVAANGAEQILTTVANQWYKVTATLRNGTSTDCRVRAVNGTAAGTILAESATVTATSNTQVVLYFMATSTATSIYLRQNSTAIGQTVFFDNVSVVTIAGNHASQSTSTSRPLYQSSGGVSYLAFDGTDDFLVTGTINPGSVDKAQVFAGVRKLSDAAQGMLTEYSATSSANAGAFCLFAPQATADYGWRSRGSLNTPPAQTAGSYAAPITNVLTGIGDISADLSRLRVNGVSAATDAGNQGTGNYGSYALYIGSRAGTSVRFNGHLYSLIVRFSAANLTDAQITQAETWVNTKTLAY